MWGAIASSAISAAGSAGSGKMNRREAKRQRNWQEHMASTAYQRTMADMYKAGLNPILAYQKGGTPVGTGATGQQPDMGQAAGVGVQAFGKGLEKRRLGQELKNMQAQETVAVQQAINLQTTAKGIEYDNLAKELGMPALQAASEFDRTQAGQEIRKFKRLVDGVLGGLGMGLLFGAGRSSKSISPSTALGVNQAGRKGYQPIPTTKSIGRKAKPFKGGIQNYGR